MPPLLIAALLALLYPTPPARAALLVPGDVLSPVPLKADPVGGTVLDTLVSPVVSSSFTGTLTINVIADDDSNPFGGLTFTFGFDNDADSTDSVGRITLNDFAGFLVDASHLSPGTGPTLVDRSDDGNVIGFSFVRSPVGNGAVAPGTSGSLLVLKTDATDFNESTAAVINGSAVVVTSLAPVPEPATAGLTLIAASAVLLRRRRVRARPC